MIIENWGSGSWQSESESNPPHESIILKLDISKAKTLLNWKPIWDIEEAVGKTMDWYQNYKKKNMYNFCVEQIKSYIER